MLSGLRTWQVPEWTCETDVSTPVPRNEDDPLNENAAIAAGVILSTLFLCCMVIACMLCINSGPKDDHWNHAPRAPGGERCVLGTSLR